MRDLVLHSLAMRKVQTASVMLAVALSVMTLLALAMVFGGVRQGVAANEERSGAEAMVVPADAADTVDGSALLFTGAPAPIYFPAETAERIAGIDGIARSTTQFFTQSLDRSCCSTTGATRLIGVDFATDWTVQPFATRPLPDAIGPDAVVIGANVGGAPGQSILLLDHWFTVYDQQEPSCSDLDNSLLLDIGEARAVSGASAGLGYLWDKYGQPDSLVSAVLFDFEEGAARNMVENRITALGGVSVLERTAVVAEAQQGLEAVFAILLGVGVVMLLTTVVQLFARFYTCVWDRKGELALYRAIGASAKDLRRLIGAEAAIDTGVGYAIGLAAGIALYFGLLALLQGSTAFPFIGLAPWVVALVALGLLVVFALLAGLAIAMPLRQIGRLDPSLAMQQGDID